MGNVVSKAFLSYGVGGLKWGKWENKYGKRRISGAVASMRGISALRRGIYGVLVILRAFVVTLRSWLIVLKLSRTQWVIRNRFGLKSLLLVQYIKDSPVPF